MSSQYLAALRNAWLDLYESTIGTGPKLQIFTGAQPAACSSADSGTKIAEGNAPSDWMGAASAGAKAIANAPWAITGNASAGTGTNMGHFRLKESTVTTCYHQGSVGTSAADLIVTNLSIANTQVLNITGWDLTVGGA